MDAGSADLDREPDHRPAAGGAANPVGRQTRELIELKRTVVVLACGLGLAIASAAPAVAGSGGAYSSVRAKIKSAHCVTGCSGFDSARTGSRLRVRGSSMGQVSKIIFVGGKGPADDVKATVSKRTAKLVEVLVPAKASSGRLRAVNGDGLRSTASKAMVTIKRGGSGPLEARVVGRRVFQGASRQAQLDVLAHKPLSVSVALVRVADGAFVQAWQLGALTPGVVHSLTWNGTFGGVAQPVGRYEFRVMAAPSSGAQAASVATPVVTDAFDLVDHKFPVRGKHNYGGEAARFGAGRDGHRHQGHDVFARCGTKLAAARGGVVKLNKFQSRAGNYIVIDGAGTDIDYAYMHMQQRSPLKKGARVLTGQLIGRVGETGAAHGCHLHFEMWSGPGWYTGGQPFDPLSLLKAWDRYS